METITCQKATSFNNDSGVTSMPSTTHTRKLTADIRSHRQNWDSTASSASPNTNQRSKVIGMVVSDDKASYIPGECKIHPLNDLKSPVTCRSCAVGNETHTV